MIFLTSQASYGWDGLRDANCSGWLLVNCHPVFVLVTIHYFTFGTFRLLKKPSKWCPPPPRTTLLPQGAPCPPDLVQLGWQPSLWSPDYKKLRAESQVKGNSVSWVHLGQGFKVDMKQRGEKRLDPCPSLPRVRKTPCCS